MTAGRPGAGLRRRRAARETAAVVAVAVAVEVGLRVTTLPRLARALGVRLDGPPADPADPLAVLPAWTRLPLSRVEAVLRRWPWDDTCLRRSLVAGQRLRGLDPVLRVGVRHGAQPGAVAAHAWLEVGGRRIDRSAEGYVPLPLPAGRRRWRST